MDVDSRQPEAAEVDADADAAGVQHHKTKGGRKVKMVTRCKRNRLTTIALPHFQCACCMLLNAGNAYPLRS
jgi:hypothetical protein